MKCHCVWLKAHDPFVLQGLGESSAGVLFYSSGSQSGLMLLVLQHCPVRAVLQLPWADLHHWSQCWCDGRKLHILVLMFSGSFEMWSLLDPVPREILCPGIVGRIFGPNLVNCSQLTQFSCFLFPLYSLYRQFSGLSHIPSLSVVLVFFPSQPICPLFIYSLFHPQHMQGFILHAFV